MYALWAPRSWRATLFALTGLAIVAATALLLGIWLADLLSLIDGSDPRPGINAFYVVVAVIAPVPLLWWLGALGSVHRLRFRTVLGVEIPAPPRPPGRWPLRLARAWLSPTAWRQLGYHLLSLVIGLFGGIAVAACWSAPLVAATYPGGLPGRTPAVLVLVAALFLAAPWVARARGQRRRAGGPRRCSARVPPSSWSCGCRRWPAAGPRSSPRPTPSAAASSATCTTARSSGWSSLAMNLGMARAALGDDVPPATRKVIEQAHDEAVEALAGLRELVRGLHPAVLNDRGLDAALSGIVARAPLPVRLQVDVAPRCAPSIEAIAYFMVSEALTNIARHARASQAEVTVTRDRRPAARRRHRRRRGGASRRRRRHRAARARPAGRRGRRDPARAQPGRRADDDHGGAAMRVVIAEDSVLLRAGLTRLLTDGGFDVAAAVADGDELLRAVGEHRPGLVVVDVRMPPTHTDEGIQAALVIRRQYPDTAVMVLSQYVEESYAADLLSTQTSAVGYLLKDRVAHVPDFLESLRRVAAGGTVLDPEVVAQLVARRRSDPMDEPHAARAGRPPADGRGALQYRHRRGPAGQPQRGREVHQQHLHEARPAAHGHRAPPGPGRPQVPAHLSGPKAGRPAEQGICLM